MSISSSQSISSSSHTSSAIASPVNILTLSALVVVAAANNVLSKLSFDAYGDRYAFFVNQASNIVYVIFAAIGLLVRIFVNKRITPNMWQFPKRYLLVMGLMDALASLLSALGAVYTPGSFQVLLNQCLIPITMFVSYMALKARYDGGQVGGAVVIIAGACVAVVPSLLNPDPNAPPTRWYACAIFCLANIPNSMSTVFKEYSLKGSVSLDVYFLTFWVALFQTLWTFVFIPLQSVPGFGGFPLNSLLDNLLGGIKCTIGIDSVPEDTCSTWKPTIFFAMYLGVNFFYNVLGLLLTRTGSALLAAIAYTLQIPFTTGAFAICAVMGPDCEPFTLCSGLGLVVVMVGFGVHAYFDFKASGTEEIESKLVEHKRLLTPINEGDEETYGDHGDDEEGYHKRTIDENGASVGVRDRSRSSDFWRYPDETSENWYHSRLPDFSIGRMQSVTIGSHIGSSDSLSSSPSMDGMFYPTSNSPRKQKGRPVVSSQVTYSRSL